MSQVEITDSLIVGAYDSSENSQDSYDVAFEARALDQLVGTGGEVLFGTQAPFVEYWHFVRSENTWLLASITQETQDITAANLSVQAFAEKNGMFYSLDMGWLFLPTHGLLMARGKMGVSDINNHVVGTYHGRLTQFYTFTPTTIGNNGVNPSWLILQMTLPRSYGGIIVQRDKKFFSAGTDYTKPSKDYQKYEFEWPDFNKRYDVHATDADRLAAFELLNPGFMAYLYDNDPQVGIEVVDTTLYLYKYLGEQSSTAIDARSYEVMLTIALKAFKELQL